MLRKVLEKCAKTYYHNCKAYMGGVMLNKQLHDNIFSQTIGEVKAEILKGKKKITKALNAQQTYECIGANRVIDKILNALGE